MNEIDDVTRNVMQFILVDRGYVTLAWPKHLTDDELRHVREMVIWQINVALGHGPKRKLKKKAAP